MKIVLSLFCFIFFVSCSDNGGMPKGNGGEDESPRLILGSNDAGTEADVYVLEWEPPPPPPEPELTREERCAQTTVQESQAYCQCYPDCCDMQRWYCPPNPMQTIDVMQVVVEICDEDKVPCIFGEDVECPPPEIISQSECYTQWECPPGTSGEFIRWFECQLEDGTLGRQQIICDKGSLRHLPCRPCDEEACDSEDNDCDNLVDEGFFACENSCGPGIGRCVDGEVIDCNAPTPNEERCNFEDDDCDGEIDEGQRNVCDLCGPIPPDICDGEDNDCDGSTDEELVRECETACGRGVETCDGGNWISCTATQPVDEECDGEDNDCDGQIDEQLECLCTISDVGNLQPCSEPPLICGQGFKTCECVDPGCTEMRMTECAALCQYVPMPEPPACDPRLGISLEQEECNNFDEDCDQLVDENLTQACYTGEPETLLVGVCTPGEVYCDRGIWGNDRNNQFEPGFCLGEITPQDEICNGADDDCDGVVDYGEEIRETDILFIVDWSGSMDQEIEAVKIALNRFATHFAAEDALQWGLVIGPKEFQEDGREFLVKVSDISPFEQFLADFAALGNRGMDTGSEMLLDAVYLSARNISGNANVDIASTEWWGDTASTPEKENFTISWRPTSERIIIIFSDEVEQSFLKFSDPAILQRPITKPVVEDLVRAGIRLKVYAFSSGGWVGGRADFWSDITLAGNGSNFDLTSNALSMYNDLMSIIDEACLPRDEEQGAMIGAEPMTMLVNYKNNSIEHYHYDYVNAICEEDIIIKKIKKN
tara:strand:- start:3481 stop:5787 length:2307 start_codon:yes stop_codon:yes gene_type:complete